LITGRETPRIGAIRHQQHSQGRQIDARMISKLKKGETFKTVSFLPCTLLTFSLQMQITILWINKFFIFFAIGF